MVRRGIVLCTVLALTGCSSASARPAWPKPHPSDVDGGESLAPRPAARAITAAVEDSRPSERAVEKPAAASAPAATPSAPAAAAPADPSSEEPIETEEIVIEVDGSSP